MAKSDYAVKQSLTKEGYEVYNEVSNRLQDGSDKSKLAANENAFIYARMAESWARIRNEYGDTAYTAKDFMAEHAVNVGRTRTGDKELKIFTQKELRDAKTQLKNDIEKWEITIDTLPKKKAGSQVVVTKHTPISLRLINTADREIKMDVWKIRKVKEDHPDMDDTMLKNIPAALNDPIAIFESTTHQGSLVIITDLKSDENKANVVVPIVLDVKGKRQEALIHLLTSAYPRQNKLGEIQKDWFKNQFEGKNQRMPDKGNRPAKAYYLNTKKITEWYSANGVQFPVSGSYQISDYFDYSIADENDLRKAKEGKVLSTGQDTTFDQRAWHGSGMDFNEFNLDKALTGAGDMVHGWGIYTAKNKKNGLGI